MSDGATSIRVETHLMIDQLSPDKLQRVYEYTKRVMEESPIGNCCGTCGRPLGNCDGH
jgi:hypothetical protein